MGVKKAARAVADEVRDLNAAMDRNDELKRRARRVRKIQRSHGTRQH